ncbi:glycosyltransferase family 2 protein [Crocosphaera sp.]|uniref:glycosyltransferase family 2 protein n=1 Tax=Crocosphaera sp. TaxID=2729996 RepID=UPI0026326AE5|nr:glycosyltransferase family 2 protein [Crocosphaera sp.]MDJ0582176.1 glycosyltransferase family 2 protein [Crocosphaera sp.]
MLPYYMNHYQSIAERFIILDDSSSDGSVGLLKSYPNVELGKFRNRNNLFVRSFVKNALKFYNDYWKKSRGKADWVIICNVDEHLYHQDIVSYLKYCQEEGITILPSKGYEMISEEFPDFQGRLCDNLVEGMPVRKLGKMAIFNPNEIEEMNYVPGRHEANPTGNVVFPDQSEIKLLHYKYLGFDYLKQRYKELKTGLRLWDILKKFGYHYQKDEQALRGDFERIKNNAIPVINPTPNVM